MQGEPFHKRKPDAKQMANGLHYWALPNYNQNILEYLNIKDGRGYLVVNDCIDLAIKIHISKSSVTQLVGFR